MSRDRDRKLELALKHELRAAGTPAREACLEAETLGAWTDGGLEAAQMEAVELHVSTCARCQAIVGATARSAPVISPIVNQRTFRFPRWVLAPLAAAAAVTLWMIVPQETMQAPPAPVTATAPAQDAVTQPQEKASAVPLETPPAARASDNALADAKRERGNAAPALAETASVGAVGAAASAPAPPAAPAALQKSARALAPVEIVSPDPRRRWRVMAGSIERSEDSGASWIPIHLLIDEVITGGTAPTRSICWLIGSRGLVLLTADGVGFARVPIPERVDLTAITATDARSATVTTADGRQFQTGDSGRNWRQN